MLPISDSFECINQTINSYASDQRGIITYRFNNLGYRNDIDYTNQPNGSIGLYFGSSITSAIGIEWNKGFPFLSSKLLDVQCYHFSKGCITVDNSDIVNQIECILEEGLTFNFAVIQFIDLNRRMTNGETAFVDNQIQNLDLFVDNFNKLESLLKNKKWCFLGCDGTNSNIPEYIKQHKNCVVWNPKFIDTVTGLNTQHPGEKWHKMISLGIYKKLT